MARGTTFLSLYTMLRNELGRSSSVAVGVDDLPRLKNAINATYEELAERADWPFLFKVFDVIPLAAGQQHYDFPSTLNFDRIHESVIWYDGRCSPIKRGITIMDYNLYNSNEDERSDPVRKWEVRNDGNTEQIEVWPLPASNDMEMQFSGFRKIARLVNNADVCLLDDWLIVKFAKIGLLKDTKDIAVAKEEAGDRFLQLTANMQAGEAPFRFGLGPSGETFVSPSITVTSGS